LLLEREFLEGAAEIASEAHHHAHLGPG